MNFMDNGTLPQDRPGIEARLGKWQKMVDLVASVYSGSASLVCQLTDTCIRPVVSSDQDTNPFPVGSTFPLEAQTFCHEVITRKQPLYVGDAAKDPYWSSSPIPTEHGVRSYYGLPIFLPDGKPFGTICIMDLAETQYSQAFLKLLSCFRDLVEADLISAARYLNQTEFLSAVSHELRTPMNGVIGMAESLMASGLTPDQLSEINTIKDCAETLVIMLNDILDLSEIEAGQLDITCQPFNPTEMVENMEILWRQKARTKGLDFKVEAEGAIPIWLSGDSNRIKQVLSNLVSNALECIDDGSVTVRLSGTEGEDRRFRLRVAVVDTGLGLSAPQRDRVFDHRIQAPLPGAHRFGGAGFGLAISKKLVELMGGQIGVESEPASGSNFNFELPLEIASHAGTQPKSPAANSDVFDASGSACARGGG